MNKLIISLLSLLIILPLSAEFQATVEFRGAAFFPCGDRFREIYGNTLASYQFEGSTPLRNNLDVWANLDWSCINGKSIGFHSSTKATIVNVSLGAKFPYAFTDSLIGYMGIGPSFSRIWVKNNSKCTSSTSDWAIGGVLKSGFNYFITESIFVDVFVDYLYQPVYFRTQQDIGGIKTGAGIGLLF